MKSDKEKKQTRNSELEEAAVSFAGSFVGSAAATAGGLLLAEDALAEEQAEMPVADLEVVDDDIPYDVADEEVMGDEPEPVEVMPEDEIPSDMMAHNDVWDEPAGGENVWDEPADDPVEDSLYDTGDENPDIDLLASNDIDPDIPFENDMDMTDFA